MKINKITYIALAVSMLSFQACQEGITPENAKDREVGFDVVLQSSDKITGMQVRSISSENGMELPLVCEEMQGRATSLPLTRGTQYNTTGSDKPLSDYSSAITSFNVTAWNSDATRFIPAAASSATAETATYASSKWGMSTRYNWVNGDNKKFYAYANLPASGASVECASNAGQKLTYTVPAAAADQNDILLGYYAGTGDSSADADSFSDGIAELKFYHPLAAIEFKKGDMVGVTAIKSISIEGVYASGYTTQSTAGETFTWTATGSQTVTLTPTGSATSLAVDADGVIGVPFIIIPQDMSTKEAVIKVVVETATVGEDVLLATIRSGKWLAGYTYSYTLGSELHKYAFTIEPSVKSVSFTNSTDDSSEATVDVSSLRYRSDGDEHPVGWTIKSYQVGSESPVTVEDNSFDGGNIVGGISSEGKLALYAKARSSALSFSKGGNSYWINDNSRTDNLDWSPADWSSQGVIDLSCLDFQSETKGGTMNTANTYIVRHAGHYKLPLIYGNAVTGGSLNTRSYNPGVTGTKVLSTFLNYKDQPIASPFIEEDITALGGVSSLKCAVLWQDECTDANPVVTNLTITTPESLTIDGDSHSVSYLKFDVDQSVICQNNALVCIYDDINGNGTYDYDDDLVIWNWNIWITNNPEVISSPIEVTNSNSVVYEFLPMQGIGWIDAASYPELPDVTVIIEQEFSGETVEITVKQAASESRGYSQSYQWGMMYPTPRKTFKSPDPLLECGSYIIPSTSPKSTLGEAISHPTVRIVGSGNWCSTAYLNLWSGGQTFSGYSYMGKIPVSGKSEYKTIYDPSPAGYMVPPSEAFFGFVSTAISGTTTTSISDKTKWNVVSTDLVSNGGLEFYTDASKTETIFFPAQGYRRTGEGNMNNIGKVCYFYCCESRSSSGFAWGMSESSLTYSSSNEIQGDYLRPVKEP